MEQVVRSHLRHLLSLRMLLPLLRLLQRRLVLTGGSGCPLLLGRLRVMLALQMLPKVLHVLPHTLLAPALLRRRRSETGSSASHATAHASDRWHTLPVRL